MHIEGVSLKELTPKFSFFQNINLTFYKIQFVMLKIKVGIILIMSFCGNIQSKNKNVFFT